jgi:hypothetical protein
LSHTRLEVSRFGALILGFTKYVSMFGVAYFLAYRPIFVLDLYSTPPPLPVAYMAYALNNFAVECKYGSGGTEYMGVGALNTFHILKMIG